MSNVDTYEIEGRAATRFALTSGAELIRVSRYLTPSEAAALRTECERLPWEHQRIRGVPTRRANAWLADVHGSVGEPDEPFITIDDHDFTPVEFAKMVSTFGGWGMRIVFVPDNALHEEPSIEVREPEPRRL